MTVASHFLLGVPAFTPMAVADRIEGLSFLKTVSNAPAVRAPELEDMFTLAEGMDKALNLHPGREGRRFCQSLQQTLLASARGELFDLLIHRRALAGIVRRLNPIQWRSLSKTTGNGEKKRPSSFRDAVLPHTFSTVSTHPSFDPSLDPAPVTVWPSGSGAFYVPEGANWRRYPGNPNYVTHPLPEGNLISMDLIHEMPATFIIRQTDWFDRTQIHYAQGQFGQRDIPPVVADLTGDPQLTPHLRFLMRVHAIFPEGRDDKTHWAVIWARTTDPRQPPQLLVYLKGEKRPKTAPLFVTFKQFLLSFLLRKRGEDPSVIYAFEKHPYPDPGG